MIWWVYNLVFPLVFLFLLPHFIWRMLRRGGYARNFVQRLGCYSTAIQSQLAAPDHPVWIQAVSVGELAVAFSFMEEMRRQHPSIRFVLTTNTSTGYALALKKIQAPDAALYFPMDLPWVMSRVLRRIHPAAVVLVENEMWPNLIRYARASGIPSIMINGRISAHSYKGYRKIRFITRRLLPQIEWFCMQSAGDMERLLELGAPAERMTVTGSAKYDIAPTPPEAGARARAVLEKAGWHPGGLILLGGSTWPGEEAALLDIYMKAKTLHPQLLLVLVPRHAERRAEVLEEIAERGLSVVQRSLFPDDAQPLPERPDVLLVDTTGELRGFYSVADVVFVGKSLTQTGGQNPIEPARDGRAIVVGPHMGNFPVVSEDFKTAGAYVQAADRQELEEIVLDLLAHPEHRTTLGVKAVNLVAAKAGATGRMVVRVWTSINKSL